jgi:MarR family transcriptional regulator for hemolysin
MAADFDNDVLMLVMDVARHLCTCGDRLAQAHGITHAQLRILARLEREPNLSQCELATIAEVSAMTIARQVDCLAALGLVERRPDPADRRIWRLRLTSKAAPLRRELHRVHVKLLNITTKGIEPTVLRATTLGLRQMKENVSSRRFAEESS